MLYYILALIYLLAALGTAYLGRKTFAGPVGTFLLAMLLTPLIVFPVLLLFRPRLRAR